MRIFARLFFNYLGRGWSIRSSAKEASRAFRTGLNR